MGVFSPMLCAPQRVIVLVVTALLNRPVTGMRRVNRQRPAIRGLHRKMVVNAATAHLGDLQAIALQPGIRG